MFTNKKRWIFVGCFAILACAVFVLVNNNSFAACGPDGKYCYGTGSGPRGGLCGDPNNNGVWWDTCFGLSWQYYEWPTNSQGEPYEGDISFPGSSNAGYATVSRQCKDYGGFWFLGYEAYRPSTNQSLGYQVGSPKAGMLVKYDSTHGYTDLYEGEDGEPAVNPNITLNINGETKRIRGEFYGTEYDMKDRDGKIRKLFDKYATADTEAGQKGLIGGSGKGVDEIATLADINWFCAEEDPIPDPPEKKVSGLVTVTYGTRSETAGWNNTGKAIIYISIREGQSAEITFEDFMVNNGDVPVVVPYDINGSFISNPPESGSFVAFQGDHETKKVGSHTQTVNTSGEYCERLTFTYQGVTRLMQACAVVTVIPTPPEIYGRVGVEATIYDEDDNVKSTIPLAWTNWNDPNALIVPIALANSDYVDINFTDDMKGVGDTPADMDYTITNNALAGVKVDDTFHYAGTIASDQATTLKETFFDDVNQRSLICETLTFGKDENSRSIVACADVTKGQDPPLPPTVNNVGGDFDFNVDVNLKLSVSLSNRLVKASGINGDFLRDYTTLGVSSNNHEGYIATFTTDKKSTNENATNLIHDYKDSIVPTLETTTTRGDFPTGRWGYSIDDTLEGDDESTYAPLVAMDSLSPIQIMDVDAPGAENQDVYFAAKMDAIQPTGTYSNSVVFKVVTKVTPPTPTTIDEIQYMQEINDDVIASMVINQQYQKTDVRDGKKYWFVKLPNEAVIMTQNLDLELHYGDVLSGVSSDIGYGDARGGYKSGRSHWLVDHTTQTTLSDPLTRYWYARSADGNTLQSNVATGNYLTNAIGGHSYRAASNPAVGTFGEESYDYYVGPDSTPGHYLSDADCAAATGYTEEICAHGRLGVLYNDTAAMAGPEPRLGGYTRNNNEYYALTDSICPKGWRLPNYADYSMLNNMINTYQDISTRTEPLYLAGIPYYEDSGYLSRGYSSYTDDDGIVHREYYSFWQMSRSDYYNRYLYVYDRSISYGTANSYSAPSDGYAVRCFARNGIKN